jgi:hypothetical protein
MFLDKSRCLNVLPSFSAFSFPEKIQSKLSILKEEHLLFSNLIDYRLNPSDFLKNIEIPSEKRIETEKENKICRGNADNPLNHNNSMRYLQEEGVEDENNGQKRLFVENTQKKSCFLQKIERSSPPNEFIADKTEKTSIEAVIKRSFVCSLEKNRRGLLEFLAFLFYFFLSLLNLSFLRKKNKLISF